MQEDKKKIVDVATQFIKTILGSGSTPDSMYSLWEINHGNKGELLQHLKAVNSIITDAIAILEEDK